MHSLDCYLRLPFADSGHVHLVKDTAANAHDTTDTIDLQDSPNVKEQGATVHIVSNEQFMDDFPQKRKKTSVRSESIKTGLKIEWFY